MAFVRGMGAGLYVSEPADYGQPATEPEPVSITVQEYAPAGSLELRLKSSADVFLPANTVLWFGVMPVLVTAGATISTALTVTVDVDSVEGDEGGGIPYAISPTASAAWNRLVRVMGTTSTTLEVQGETTDITSALYTGSKSVPWSRSATTRKSWRLPREGNFRPRDLAYLYVRTAFMEGRELFMQRVLPDETGKPVQVESGTAIIPNGTLPAPAGGIVTASWEFMGQGPLAIDTISEPAPGSVMLDFSNPNNAINLMF